VLAKTHDATNNGPTHCVSEPYAPTSNLQVACGWFNTTHEHTYTCDPTYNAPLSPSKLSHVHRQHRLNGVLLSF